MTNKTAQADNITMSAGGLYSLSTIGAKHVIDKSIPLVIDALQSIESAEQGFWNFSDMGCADGGTSLDLWRAVASHIRANNSSAIQIVYADQVFNDFNALVQILHGHTPFKSYLSEFADIHILQSGSSFYSPILPPDSLHLGFSATAMHWLRQKPCDITDHVHMIGAAGPQADAFAQQAAQDWQNILINRARELKRGGKLVLVNFCIDEQGRYLGNTGGVNMFDQFNTNWQSFLDDGVIQQAEYEAMTLPQYYNTIEEFSAPFNDSGSDVYQSGLRLQTIDTAVVACPFAQDYKTHGDAEKFAEAYIPTIRSWNESTFMGALSRDRPLQQRQEIIEAYYQQYQQQVASQPQGHGMGYVHAYTVIEKT